MKLPELGREMILEESFTVKFIGETYPPCYPEAMQQNYEQFIQKFPKTEQQKLLAPLVTFNIGGPADLFYKLTNSDEFENLVKTAQELKIPFFILGGGSNTIFADEGFRGLVIHMSAKNIVLKSEAGEALVAAESGALLSQVIQFSLKNKLTGIEKMMGLPGTIGGAVRGNAGAFGIEIKDVFHKALIYSPQKGVFEADADHLNFDYRTSEVKKSASNGAENTEIVLKVWLKLSQASPEQAKTALAEATDIVKNRISKQPKGKCSGSFFKNPVTPDYKNPEYQPKEAKAGYLLEQIGAKGTKIGGAQVSPEHANWLMNIGNATQKDVLELSKLLQSKVKERFNISLEREVQLVGETGPLIN